MPAQFQAAHFERAVLRDGEKTVGHGHVLKLPRRQKHDVAIDGLDGQRQLRARGDFFGERFVIGARRARFLHVQRIDQRVQNFVAAILGHFFCYQQRFPRHGIDGFVRLDFSEARIFVTGVAEAADQQPFERVALQLVAFPRTLSASVLPGCSV